jgi:alkylation response protein AidB-like acyl-CoA dehydrogenase
MKKGGAFLLEPVVTPTFTREMFSEDQTDINRMVREFAQERILEQREELAANNGELSRQIMAEVGELGMTAVDVPEAYGGLELDKTTSAMVVEALTRGGSASWVVTFSAHVGIGTLPLVYFGTEEQKAKYLPKLASGEHLAAYALTEPGAGSDAQNLETTAVLSEDGEHYILNGTKIYVTNGGWADLYTIFAKIDGKQHSAFLVERDFEGLKIGAEEHKLGIKGSSTVTLFLDNLKVPKENLLGAAGAGFPIALNALNIGRFKLGAADLGGSKHAIGYVTEFALERLQFGQPIAYFDAIRRKLAEMVTRTYGLDSVIYRTVGLMDERIGALDSSSESYNKQAMDALEEYAIEASISKILGSENMAWIADQGIQTLGGSGFSEEYPLAEMYRDTRIDRIFEGTNEINRMVIYGYLLKKGLTEELSIRDGAKQWTVEMEEVDGPLTWELKALDAGRRLTVKCLFEAISLYGQDLRNEQVVGEDLADLVINYFAASAAVNRLLQAGELEKDRAQLAVGRLAVAHYLEELWRLWYRLRPSLFATAYGETQAAEVDALVSNLHLPFDPVTEIRLLTDDLYHHGHYRFE